MIDKTVANIPKNISALILVLTEIVSIIFANIIGVYAVISVIVNEKNI